MFAYKCKITAMIMETKGKCPEIHRIILPVPSSLFLLARLTQSQSQFSNFSHKLKIHLIISRVVTLCTLFTEWEL